MLVSTYNIQWGKGRDGVVDLGRIARAVADADIIGLQEVERNWREMEPPDIPSSLKSSTSFSRMNVRTVAPSFTFSSLIVLIRSFS